MNKNVGFCGHFKMMMSLDQSLLTTSSEVGPSRWAILQRRQDSIGYGCDGGCDNDGVHKGLVFTVIVTQALSSFYYSTFILFS